MKTKFFVLSGCFRSGTTLMRQCLSAHADVLVLNEDRSAACLRNTLRPLEAVRVIGFKMPVAARQIDASMDYWRSNYDSNMKLVWMRRDPLQWTASVLTMPHFSPRLIRMVHHTAEKDEKFAEENKVFLKEFEKKPGLRINQLSLLAIYWRDCQHRFNCTSNALAVNYNDLTLSTERTLFSCLDFLDLEKDFAVLNPEKSYDAKEHWGKGLYEGGHNPARPIDSSSLEKWQSVLNEAEIEHIKFIVEEKSND